MLGFAFALLLVKQSRIFFLFVYPVLQLDKIDFSPTYTNGRRFCLYHNWTISTGLWRELANKILVTESFFLSFFAGFNDL